MATAKQKKLWRDYKRNVENIDLRCQANAVRVQMCYAALDFGNRNNLPIAFDTQAFDKHFMLVRAVNRAKRLIDAVESEKLGLRFTHGDIDIMAPPDMTADEIAEFQMMGFVLIAVGVVVIAGIIATQIIWNNESLKLTDEYNHLLEQSDNKYCADPASPTCAAWLNRKKAEGFKPKKNIIERLESGIKAVASSATSGLGIGIALAIPLAAYIFAKGNR